MPRTQEREKERIRRARLSRQKSKDPAREKSRDPSRAPGPVQGRSLSRGRSLTHVPANGPERSAPTTNTWVWIAKGKAKAKRGTNNQEPIAVETTNQFTTLDIEEETGIPIVEDHQNLIPDKETVINREGKRVRYPVVCKPVARETEPDKVGDTQKEPSPMDAEDDLMNLRVEDLEIEDMGTQEEPNELEPGADPHENNQADEENGAEVNHGDFPSLQEAVAESSGKKGRK